MTILAIAANLLLIAAVFFAGARTRTALGLLALIGTPVILLIARRKDIIYRSVLAHDLGSRADRDRAGRRAGTLAVKAPQDRSSSAAANFPGAMCCSDLQSDSVSVHRAHLPVLRCSARDLGRNRRDRPGRKAPGLLVAAVFCFYLLYVMLEVTPGWHYPMGLRYLPETQSAKLTLPRAGGLRVFPESARTYEELGVLLSQHGSGKYIYATPDCPEVYFLYSFRNPTRTLYDFNDDPEVEHRAFWRRSPNTISSSWF